MLIKLCKIVVVIKLNMFLNKDERRYSVVWAG